MGGGLGRWNVGGAMRSGAVGWVGRLAGGLWAWSGWYMCEGGFCVWWGGFGVWYDTYLVCVLLEMTSCIVCLGSVDIVCSWGVGVGVGVSVVVGGVAGKWDVCSIVGVVV